MRIREKQRERERRTCRHFNGILNDACKAGVRYQDVEKADKGPHPHPCASNNEHGHCSLFEARTDADIDERERSITRSLELTRRGLSSCCEAPLDESQVITSGRFKGHGPRFCSKCGKCVFMV